MSNLRGTAANGLGEVAPSASPSRSVILRSALSAVGLVAAGFSLRFAPTLLDPKSLDRAVLGHGVEGVLLFVLAVAMGCAVGLPRQAAAFAGGYLFGVAFGAVLALFGQLAGCGVDFGWARVVARPWAARRMRGRLARFEAFLAGNPFRAILLLRLLPVGNNLALNLVAGVSRIPLWPFLFASALGYVPQTMVFALLGGGVRVSHSAQIALGVALFAVSTALGILLLRARPGRP